MLEPRTWRARNRAAGRRRKRTGSSAGSPVSSAADAIAARAFSSSRPAVFSATQATRAGRDGERDALVQLDQLGQARQRVARVTLDLGRAGPVAEHEDVRGRAVDQAERHARVRGMRERALALDEEELAAAPAALDDQPLGGAREEVGDDGVDGDPPARDRDPGLAGRDEHRGETAPPGLEVELERDGLLSDRAVGADGQGDLRRELEVLAGRDVQIRGRPAAGRAARRRARARARRAPGRRRGTRAGRSRRRARSRCTPSAARARPVGSGRPASRRRRSRWSGSKRRASSTVATIGIPSCVSPARVESTIATVGSGA